MAEPRENPWHDERLVGPLLQRYALDSGCTAQSLREQYAQTNDGFIQFLRTVQGSTSDSCRTRALCMLADLDKSSRAPALVIAKTSPAGVAEIAVTPAATPATATDGRRRRACPNCAYQEIVTDHTMASLVLDDGLTLGEIVAGHVLSDDFATAALERPHGGERLDPVRPTWRILRPEKDPVKTKRPRPPVAPTRPLPPAKISPAPREFVQRMQKAFGNFKVHEDIINTAYAYHKSGEDITAANEELWATIKECAYANTRDRDQTTAQLNEIEGRLELSAAEFARLFAVDLQPDTAARSGQFMIDQLEMGAETLVSMFTGENSTRAARTLDSLQYHDVHRGMKDVLPFVILQWAYHELPPDEIDAVRMALCDPPLQGDKSHDDFTEATAHLDLSSFKHAEGPVMTREEREQLVEDFQQAKLQFHAANHHAVQSLEDKFGALSLSEKPPEEVRTEEADTQTEEFIVADAANEVKAVADRLVEQGGVGYRAAIKLLQFTAGALAMATVGAAMYVLMPGTTPLTDRLRAITTRLEEHLGNLDWLLENGRAIVDKLIAAVTDQADYKKNAMIYFTHLAKDIPFEQQIPLMDKAWAWALESDWLKTNPMFLANIPRLAREMEIVKSGDATPHVTKVSLMQGIQTQLYNITAAGGYDPKKLDDMFSGTLIELAKLAVLFPQAQTNASAVREGVGLTGRDHRELLVKREENAPVTNWFFAWLQHQTKAPLWVHSFGNMVFVNVEAAEQIYRDVIHTVGYTLGIGPGTGPGLSVGYAVHTFQQLYKFIGLQLYGHLTVRVGVFLTERVTMGMVKALQFVPWALAWCCGKDTPAGGVFHRLDRRMQNFVDGIGYAGWAFAKAVSFINKIPMLQILVSLLDTTFTQISALLVSTLPIGPVAAQAITAGSMMILGATLCGLIKRQQMGQPVGKAGLWVLGLLNLGEMTPDKKPDPKTQKPSFTLWSRGTMVDKGLLIVMPLLIDQINRFSTAETVMDRLLKNLPDYKGWPETIHEREELWAAGVFNYLSSIKPWAQKPRPPRV